MSKLLKDQIVYFMFRIKYEVAPDEYEFKTLSILQKINNAKSTFNALLNFYIGSLNIKNELYYITKIDAILFTYKIVPDGGKAALSKDIKIGASLKYKSKIERLKF
jgi:hypothetical protein